MDINSNRFYNLTNRAVFFIIAIFLLLYSYFLMVFAAADVYSDQDGASNNVIVHFLRFGLVALFLLTIILNKFRILKSKLSYLVIVWILWMIVCNLVDIDRYLLNLTFVLLWPLCFIAFQQLSRNIKNNRIIISYFSILFCFTSVMYFFIATVMNVGVIGKLASVNHIYYVILLIPWILLIKKKLYVNICLVVVLLCTLYSAKRGAILIVLAIDLVYLYFNYFRSAKGGLSIKGFFLGAFLLVGGIFVLLEFNEGSDGYLLERFEKIEEDKGSGRLDIYSEVISNYNQAVLENKIFGHSHNSVKGSTSFNLSAHNDYIEILYDYGFIGLFLFLLLMRELFIRCRLLFVIKSRYFVFYFSLFIIILFMTLISHIILYPTYILFLVSCLGFMETEISKVLKR